MTSDKYDEVVNFLGNLQLDRWRLSSSDPKLTIMSHSHEDHNPQRSRTRPASPIATTVRYYQRLAGTSGKEYQICEYDRFSQIKNFQVLPFFNIRASVTLLRDFHADWWLITNRTSTALFVGELDYPEVSVLVPLVKRIKDAGRNLDVVLTPAYGGLTETHRIPQGVPPMRFQDSIESTMKQLKQQYALLVAALPHSTNVPEWSDFEFQYLP